MPILTVKISGQNNPERTQQIVHVLMDLTAQILGKQADVTAIVLDYVAPSLWFVGGRSLQELGKNSYYFDIKITDETNTKAEKAQYLAQVHQAFERLIGHLHEESYGYVQDVRASAYGFGGKTQEFRAHHPH